MSGMRPTLIAIGGRALAAFVKYSSGRASFRVGKGCTTGPRGHKRPCTCGVPHRLGAWYLHMIHVLAGCTASPRASASYPMLAKGRCLKSGDSRLVKPTATPNHEHASAQNLYMNCSSNMVVFVMVVICQYLPTENRAMEPAEDPPPQTTPPPLAVHAIRCWYGISRIAMQQPPSKHAMLSPDGDRNTGWAAWADNQS